MLRSFCVALHLLVEAGAVRRDARIRFLKAQVEILRRKVGGIARTKGSGTGHCPLQRQDRRRSSRPTQPRKSVASAAGGSSADCCAITAAPRPERSPAVLTQSIFDRDRV
jgi:hypothetical protein